MPTTDTIVAVSSPPGRAARGLVRLSGPGTHDILEHLVDPVPGARRLSAVVLDLPPKFPALCALFQAPGSYTGQEMAEIQCPGNPALLDRLLHRAVALGARLAEPGEFTFRAFVAGKLDLTQAEGVAATIAAVSDSQLRAATLLRRGELGRYATDLADRIADLLALVEAGIDFTDQDDVRPINDAESHQRIAQARQTLRQLLSRSRSWGELEALPRVVLAGPPNAGKSTLFNALLGRIRAVTSPTAGTTRDVLCEPLQLEGGEIMLVDLAGLDTPADALDRDIQAAAQRAIASADLLLLLGDAPVAPSSTPTLRVHAKSDLLSAPDHADVSVCALHGQGLDKLKRLIGQRLSDRAVSLSSDMLALGPRHESALRAADAHLAQAQCVAAPELLAHALRAALDALESLAGRVSPDDVLGRVFATFCVGK